MKTVFILGDRVMFARQFLHNTGTLTGAIPFLRGVVEQISPLSEDRVLCAIHWDDGPHGAVLSCNLIHEDQLHLEIN